MNKDYHELFKSIELNEEDRMIMNNFIETLFGIVIENNNK